VKSTCFCQPDAVLRKGFGFSLHRAGDMESLQIKQKGVLLGGCIRVHPPSSRRVWWNRSSQKLSVQTHFRNQASKLKVFSGHATCCPGQRCELAVGFGADSNLIKAT